MSRLSQLRWHAELSAERDVDNSRVTTLGALSSTAHRADKDKGANEFSAVQRDRAPQWVASASAC